MAPVTRSSKNPECQLTDISRSVPYQAVPHYNAGGKTESVARQTKCSRRSVGSELNSLTTDTMPGFVNHPTPPGVDTVSPYSPGYEPNFASHEEHIPFLQDFSTSYVEVEGTYMDITDRTFHGSDPLMNGNRACAIAAAEPDAYQYNSVTSAFDFNEEVVHDTALFNSACNAEPQDDYSQPMSNDKTQKELFNIEESPVIPLGQEYLDLQPTQNKPVEFVLDLACEVNGQLNTDRFSLEPRYLGAVNPCPSNQDAPQEVAPKRRGRKPAPKPVVQKRKRYTVPEDIQKRVERLALSPDERYARIPRDNDKKRKARNYATRKCNRKRALLLQLLLEENEKLRAQITENKFETVIGDYKVTCIIEEVPPTAVGRTGIRINVKSVINNSEQQVV